MSNSNDADDDVPQLSADTFRALQEFYKEQEEKEKRLHLILDNTDDSTTIDEDWQLSQFWYNEKTVENLVKIAVSSVGPSGKVALLSCPTLFTKLKVKLGSTGIVTLYEYDTRFAIYGDDFIPYDYKTPLNVPKDKSGYYDLVIADPPFLSDECLTKTAVTIKYLTNSKIIVCTGAIMEDLIKRLLNVHVTSFKPQHKNNLANEFSCYANFNIEQFIENSG